MESQQLHQNPHSLQMESQQLSENSRDSHVSTSENNHLTTVFEC